LTRIGSEASSSRWSKNYDIAWNRDRSK
jgi:hypothetical protein